MANSQITDKFGLKNLNNADANSIRSAGVLFGAGFTNAPNSTGWLLNMPQTNGSYYLAQMFISTGENSLYIRRLNGSVWSAWTKLGGVNSKLPLSGLPLGGRHDKQNNPVCIADKNQTSEDRILRNTAEIRDNHSIQTNGNEQLPVCINVQYGKWHIWICEFRRQLVFLQRRRWDYSSIRRCRLLLHRLDTKEVA